MKACGDFPIWTAHSAVSLESDWGGSEQVETLLRQRQRPSLDTETDCVSAEIET